ncbi:HAD family phosphatase [Ramlibacter sp. AW1]|uniref:HAD family phosphatase n=1 Tax=Ramlibacter aurantiacus TaxID=2801330 RepID=A0A936ZUP7_9BURK|nr:HAD family phosphatase [Ramlibacter aurantiacus]MBL0421500.1 HAD family phosphatase [Ramlibacter aurantiacus]
MPLYQATLFDCDGVLVDSEGITHAVLSELMAELDWCVSPEECARIFGGKGVVEERVLIETRTGRPLPPEWVAQFRSRRDAELRRSLRPIPHALEAVARAHAAYGERMAVASGAYRSKVEMQLRLCGLSGYFEGRVFSGQEQARSKPHPDVYLAAAAALGVDPRACVVIEDTVTGVAAGVAAGATVLGYCPRTAAISDAGALVAAGAARVIADLRELDALI